MLALALVLLGALVSVALLLESLLRPHVPMGDGFLALGVATVLQLIVAAAMVIRAPGAWALAMLTLVVHVLAVLVMALILMLLVALPMEGGGPLPGHPFNPEAFVIILAATAGILAIYALGVRSAWRLRSQPARTRRSATR